MRPQRLPDELTLPFAVGDALERGVSRGRLRAADLRAPFYGVRAGAASDIDDLEASVRRRCLEYAPRMAPDQFACLVAACVLWEAPLPSGVFRVPGRDGGSTERPLDVGVILPGRAPRARGVRGRSVVAGLASTGIHPSSGLRVTTPATTWAMMAPLLARDDLVALGDAFVREPMRDDDPPARETIDGLRAAMRAGRRLGAARLREALPLIRTRSRSRQETRLRLLLVDAGLPEPELNLPVVVHGQVVALVDGAYPAAMIALEYEGEHHLRDPQQWSRDIARYEMLAALGWHVIRVTKSDLTVGRGALVRRVRRALRARS